MKLENKSMEKWHREQHDRPTCIALFLKLSYKLSSMTRSGSHATADSLDLTWGSNVVLRLYYSWGKWEPSTAKWKLFFSPFFGDCFTRHSFSRATVGMNNHLDSRASHKMAIKIPFWPRLENSDFSRADSIFYSGLDWFCSQVEQTYTSILG